MRPTEMDTAEALQGQVTSIGRADAPAWDIHAHKRTGVGLSTP
jgi:hypothetical protein